MPAKSNKKRSKAKKTAEPANPKPRPVNGTQTPAADDDDEMPPLEPAIPAANQPHSRTGLSPELESVHLSTTATLNNLAATPELSKAAQELYRGLDRDLMSSLPEDSDYWLSLPPTIKTFVQNAYAHGMFPAAGNVTGDLEKDRPAMYTAAQQLANGQQGKRGGAVATPPYPPGAYPSYPPFDASVFSDPAFTQALEQLMPRGAAGQPQGPVPPPGMHPDFNGGEEFYSEDEEDEVELDSTLHNGRDITQTRVTVSYDINGVRKTMTTTTNHTGSANPNSKAAPVTTATTTTTTTTETKKQQQKKPMKSTVPVPPTPSLPPPPNPAPNPPPQTKQTPIQSAKPQQQQAPPPTLAPPSRPAPTPNPPIPPSSRAAGKQPMSYAPAQPPAAVPPRSARSTGKAPATAPQHYQPSPPASTKAAPTKPRPPAGTQPSAVAQGKKTDNRIWSSTPTEDRERIKDFWLGLSEKERRKLVELEKDAVLKKMKEQQRHSCGCAVCGRKR